MVDRWQGLQDAQGMLDAVLPGLTPLLSRWRRAGGAQCLDLA